MNAQISLLKLDGSVADSTDLQDTQGKYRSLSVKLTYKKPYKYCVKNKNSHLSLTSYYPHHPFNPIRSPSYSYVQKKMTVLLDKNGLSYLEFDTIYGTENIDIKVVNMSRSSFFHNFL